MNYMLSTEVGPVEKELLPAQGDRAAVKVSFNRQPTPMSLRLARRAVGEILRDGLPDALDRAGDAFTRAILRHNIVGWSGLDDAAGTPVIPTHDREVRDEAGELIEVEPGTISAFLSDPRLVEAGDREYVLPWTRLDAEKNGSAPSQNGTSAGAMPDSNIAGSSAMPSGSDDARLTPTPEPTAAPMKSTSRKRTKAKRSGS